MSTVKKCSLCFQNTTCAKKISKTEYICITNRFSYSKCEFNQNFTWLFIDNNKYTKLKNLQKIHLKKDEGGTRIDCDCGNTFFTIFPLESNPPCDYCTYCNKLHRDSERDDVHYGLID